MLRAELIKKGAARDIYALHVGNRCDTRDYLSRLERPDFRTLDVTIQRIAETGRAGHGETRFRRLKGTKNVYEIKEHGSNTRLFCFRHGQRMVICTHGTAKPGRKEYKDHIRRVERLYRQWLDEGAPV